MTAGSSVVFSGYFGFLYLLQVLWFPLPSTGTPVSSTFYRYSGFLYLLQVLLFPLPSTGTPVSSTSYRYSRFLYLLQVPKYPQETTDLSQVTHKLSHKSMLDQVHLAKFTTLVVMGTDCICTIYIYNLHM